MPPLRRQPQGVQHLLAELNSTFTTLLDRQGTSERRARLLGRITEYLLVALVVLVLAAVETGRWYFKTPPQPLWSWIFASAITLYAGLRIAMILPQLRVLSREREARRLLHAAIQNLCARGYVLFEGVTNARGWSLGSVLAGPNGVFCLIPRFLPRGRNLAEKIEHPAQDSLLVAGREVLADPLGQARHAASDLYEILAAAGLDTIPVQPVVIFPGWTVTRAAGFGDPDVLVTSDQFLESEIRAYPGTLEPREVIALGLFLEKHTTAPGPGHGPLPSGSLHPAGR